MRYVKWGHHHYTNGFDVNDRDYDLAFKKFQSKCWGLVDKETWKENDNALKTGEGIIKAKYRDERGKYYYVIILCDHGNYLFTTMEDELNNGSLENFIEQLNNRPTLRKKTTILGRSRSDE